LHRFYGKNTIIGASFSRKKFLSEPEACSVAENALILARHLLHRNFSFCKNPIVKDFLGKKTEPQFRIKIGVLIWQR